MRQTPSLSPFKHVKSDFPAGVVVFLVALPLCLGIAFASNAPLISGLVAGIVGGIVVAALSRAPLAVSGPAAGLTVIVVNSILELGSFEAFLVAVILAGAMQVVMGIVKAGRIAHYFPISVIKGMLAGIGAVLILKQIPHAFGFDGDFEGDFAFSQADGRNTLTEIPYALGHFHLGATIIAMISLAILIFWPKVAKLSKRLKDLPAPLLVVGLGIGLNAAFETSSPGLSVREHLLVGVPIVASFGELFASLPTPDFSVIGKPQVWEVAAVVAAVASIETLLCVEAIDRIDPLK
ncbi:MAG: SulP family inorganic anion transporter, partial [Nannocystaceae bacterium]